MMSMEDALIAVIGIVLGTDVSTTTLAPFSIAASDSLTPSGPPWICLAVISTAATLALTATLLPAFSTLGKRSGSSCGPIRGRSRFPTIEDMTVR
jgi:putative ABC transport system permease protein